jgi:DNA gyrase/topoisomerase IV subunit A
MNKRMALASATMVALLTQASGVKAQNAAVTEPQKELLNAVLEMRADFLQFLMQAEQSSIRALKSELDLLQQKEHRLKEADEGRSRQVMEIEQQLSSPDLESETRPQVEAVKQQLLGEAADNLRSEETVLQKRQADLTARLENELRQFQVSRQRAEQVQKALGR